MKNIVIYAFVNIFCFISPVSGIESTKDEDKNMTKYSNKLALETSPYLLQHADNPVDWYPWSAEAFEKARSENKPIFLSIGYSTCHWCHVMEHESFENEQIAKILNDHFISIKVDREERPDIDSIYMKAVQSMTGSGGWPLSVFLTPEGKPFFAGTYFPPVDSYGKPGFDKLLLSIAEAWKNQKDKLVDSADKINELLSAKKEIRLEKFSKDIFLKAAEYFINNFDVKYGGFGTAPKFPQPSSLSMLLCYWKQTGDDEFLGIVTTTLDAIYKGGIYDHLGGGFHRYSTDAEWLVPHFEKMLYDQALLTRSYIQAYQITGNKEYARIVNEVFEYVMRDLSSPEGGFYSAEDADSEGKEGTFYLWTEKEIDSYLGKQAAKLFKEYYGITKKGNFEGKNILHITAEISELRKKHKLSEDRIMDMLNTARLKLLNERNKRIRPSRDEKIITGWNGLLISSLSLGGRFLNKPEYIEAAQRAGNFILNKLYVDGRLKRYYKKDKAVKLAVLDDYAFTIMGLIDLYEADFDTKWLIEAKLLSLQMIELFADENGGGFFLSGRDGEKLIIRTKPEYDGAIPSGNSAAAMVLLKLGHITMDKQFTEKGRGILEDFSYQLENSGGALPEMLMAADYMLGTKQEIIIAGNRSNKQTQQMIQHINKYFIPNAIVLLHEGGQNGRAIEEVVEYIKDQTSINNKPTVYICENYTCNAPVNEMKDFIPLLKAVVSRVR